MLDPRAILNAPSLATQSIPNLAEQDYINRTRFKIDDETEIYRIYLLLCDV